ncbi:hypothetical protein PR048_031599 [Dryococelus australis]|uniref:Uncharacterized protein n=1 Tax=Dryococelus australis TaxID=614101 RepID=A0ABQ9G9S1_9NEOP|nr:hypothetical protein PR048_031599 [Dryococelus australis]
MMCALSLGRTLGGSTCGTSSIQECKRRKSLVHSSLGMKEHAMYTFARKETWMGAPRGHPGSGLQEQEVDEGQFHGLFVVGFVQARYHNILGRKNKSKRKEKGGGGWGTSQGILAKLRQDLQQPVASVPVIRPFVTTIVEEDEAEEDCQDFANILCEENWFLQKAVLGSVNLARNQSWVELEPGGACHGYSQSLASMVGGYGPFRVQGHWGAMLRLTTSNMVVEVINWGFGISVDREIPSGAAVAQWIERSKWGLSGSGDRAIPSGALVVHRVGVVVRLRTVRLKEVIRQHINDMPSTSTRSITRQMGVPHSTGWDVLGANRRHPYRWRKRRPRVGVVPLLPCVLCLARRYSGRVPQDGHVAEVRGVEPVAPLPVDEVEVEPSAGLLVPEHLLDGPSQVPGQPRVVPGLVVPAHLLAEACHRAAVPLDDRVQVHGKYVPGQVERSGRLLTARS